MKNKRLLIMLLLALFVPWAAMAQKPVPYNEGFENFSSEADLTADGWISAGASDCYIGITTTYYTEGSKALLISAWDGSNQSDSEVAALPVLNKPVNQLQITLSYRQRSGGTVRVGYLTDANDASTFVSLKSLPSSTSGFTTTTVELNEAPSTAARIAIQQYTWYDCYIDDIKVKVIPTCVKPTNLACTATTGTPATATFTWTNGSTETNWALEYGTASDFTGATSVSISESDLVNGKYTLTTGLIKEQKYYARLKAVCDPSNPDDESDWSNTVDFKPTNAIPQTVCDGTVPGTTSITNDYIPVYGNYAENYNKDEFIIPATTEGMANMADGTISAMTFYLSSPASDLWGAALYRVFMKEVNESSFASTSYYGTDGATIVYEGALDGTQSTMTIEFTTDYEYNGGNLLVGIYEYNKGSYKSCSFYGITSTNGSMYKNNSTSLESITSGNLQNFIPKTTFTYLPTNTPKPKNLSIVENSLSSSGVTLQWQAPTTATPTGYEYQYKVSTGEWPTTWTTATGLTAPLSTLTATTDYTFRVRAKYAEGNSDPAEIEFTTLDNCAIPTGFAATTIPGQGTKATFSWTKGFVDDDDWVLQYGTDNTFTTCTEITDGFTVEGNTVSYTATSGITAEQLHYARVRTDCGGTYSTWSNVAEFTPSNYVDYTYGLTASSTNSYIPFYGSYANDNRTVSQYIIPATELGDIAGGTIRSLTYYTSSTPNWGDATVFVYVKEVDYTTFASGSESALEVWTTMTQVYNGSLTVSDGKMTITFANPYSYNGGNLMIGFKMDQTGTSASVSWSSIYNSSAYTGLYAYYSTSYYSSGMSYNRSNYYPKTTINYQPTAYPRVAEVTVGTVTGTSVQLSWVAPSENVTGYKYQYKIAGEEWPTAWTSTTATSVNLTTEPTTDYEFQVKAVYGSVESVATTKSFSTPCPDSYPVPYTYDFESATPFTCWTIATGGSVTRKSSYPHEGTYYMCFNGSQVNEIAMPSFNEPTNTLRLEFWVRPESYTNSDCGSLAIGYYNASNEFVALKTYAYNTATSTYDGWEGNTYKKDKIDFDVAGVPADANIIFRQFNTSANYWWFIDDVKVKVIPTCEDVDNVHCASYTNHSANIAWDADAGQSAWQIAYKAGANFDPNDATELATAIIVDATANPYLFDMTLEAATTYYMYVRANCTASSDGYGDWSDSYATFTTFEATPAPSSFTASNLASQQVDLKWVEGGGDGETSWDLYYVKSTTAPTAPTSSTPATETVTTMPTPESPYVLTGLDPESTYFIWVRSNYDWNSTTSHSDWVALTGDSFTTLNNCPTPNNVEIDANSITAVEAIVTWVGSMDVSSYTVEYGEEGTYSLDETVDFSGLTTAGYDSEGVLPDGWKRYNSNPGYMPHVSDKSAYSYIDEFGDDNNYLLMTQNKSSDQYLFAIMPQISDLASLEFKYVYESTGHGTLTVGYVTDNSGYSTYQVLQTPTKSVTVQTFKLNATDIATINANNGYVTFRYEGTSTTYYSVGIDDIVYKGGTYTPGPIETKPATEQQITLTGLTPNKTYNVRVKSECTGAEWSTYASFTTLPDGTKVFTNAATDGKWSTAGNWSPVNAPALTDDVILRADATIENGCVATANSIAPSGNTLIIADGGQLQTNTAVTATVKKNITGYVAGNEANRANYYLIANPLNSTVYSSNFATVGLTSGNYDLYSWNYSASDGKEWRNYETSTFSLSTVTGYLYANESDVDLTFTGTVAANNADVNKDLNYASSGTYGFNGWNLVGNPFACNAYVKDASSSEIAFYRMNTTGDGYEAATGAIKPMEGIFVQANATGQSFKFTRTVPSTSTGNGNLNIAMAQVVTTRDMQPATDNAIVRFGEGNTLEKLSFREGSSKVYIPQDGKDYAVVSAQAQGELPLNFVAEKNGAYTLSFSAENVAFSYLHLIDNMTGADVDLLDTPSYSFDARLTDYASRFRLVFATGSSVDGDSFAFINGNGSLCIYGIDGTATLQVIDVMGRVLSSETFSGNIEKKINGTAGVYMLRLINGNNVKVQKIVVR